MMTEKEKAKELVDNFINIYKGIQLYTFKKNWAKQSSILLVDELLKANVVWYEGSIPYKYWQKVKKEIIKL